MENTLKETEWLTINKVLLEMCDITDIDQFTERVLKTYRMLIPYTKGYFIVFNEAGGNQSYYEKYLKYSLPFYFASSAPVRTIHIILYNVYIVKIFSYSF